MQAGVSNRTENTAFLISCAMLLTWYRSNHWHVVNTDINSCCSVRYTGMVSLGLSMGPPPSREGILRKQRGSREQAADYRMQVLL